MRVLVIEDDQDFVDELSVTLSRLDGPPELTVTRSRDSASAQLERQFFDLIILDLKIPTLDGALDADPGHGRAVFARALQSAPGTPVFVLTGSPAEDFFQEMLDRKRHVNIWGAGEVGTVTFLRKSSFSELSTKLAPFAAAVQRLSEVEFQRGNTDLSTQDDRLIRIFARRVNGVRCVGSLIGGGLSSAKVIRLKVTNSAGERVHDAVVKLGTLAEVREESARYKNHISKLGPAATPRELETLEFGAKDRAAVFYSLMDGFDQDAFEVCSQAGTIPGIVIRNAQEIMRPWSDGVGETRKPIREIRQRLISDDAFQQATKGRSMLWLQEFEKREIQTRWCSIHGDLHGGNILVRSDGTCVLIDYGDVGEGPASLDPITLELSLLFHPRQPLRGCGWPSTGQAQYWGSDLDKYLNQCPAANFIKACRGWSQDVAAGQREVAAAAYTYLARQLKYADTDKNLALALLDAIHGWFLST
jgi:CheY-like chemotaxis protein